MIYAPIVRDFLSIPSFIIQSPSSLLLSEAMHSPTFKVYVALVIAFISFKVTLSLKRNDSNLGHISEEDAQDLELEQLFVPSKQVVDKFLSNEGLADEKFVNGTFVPINTTAKEVNKNNYEEPTSLYFILSVDDLEWRFSKMFVYRMDHIITYKVDEKYQPPSSFRKSVKKAYKNAYIAAKAKKSPMNSGSKSFINEDQLQKLSFVQIYEVKSHTFLDELYKLFKNQNTVQNSSQIEPESRKLQLVEESHNKSSPEDVFIDYSSGLEFDLTEEASENSLFGSGYNDGEERHESVTMPFTNAANVSEETTSGYFLSTSNVNETSVGSTSNESKLIDANITSAIDIDEYQDDGSKFIAANNTDKNDGTLLMERSNTIIEVNNSRVASNSSEQGIESFSNRNFTTIYYARPEVTTENEKIESSIDSNVLGYRDSAVVIHFITKLTTASYERVTEATKKPKSLDYQEVLRRRKSDGKILGRLRYRGLRLRV